MVRLTKIYTRGGDAGQTHLGDGSRTDKDHPRITAIGAVDETNSALGIIVAHTTREDSAASQLKPKLLRIQNDLFDLGADLSVPFDEATQDAPEPGARPPLRVTDHQVDHLEALIDDMNADLAPLTSFVLPGGHPLAAWLHVARAGCRRSERKMITLTRQATVNPAARRYINRLSDFLFVAARWMNQQSAHGDVLWIPGQHRQDTQGPQD